MLLSEFWRGISILLRNYHAINKKILASVKSEVQIVNHGIAELTNCIPTTTTFSAHANISCVSSTESEVLALLTVAEKQQALPEGALLRFKCITKKTTQNIDAWGIIDFLNNSFTFKFLSESYDDFRLQFIDSQLQVDILSQRLDVKVSARWAQHVLRPKLIKWCQHAAASEKNKQIPTISLQLVDVEQYAELYKHLKQKYAAKALQFWHTAEESTDPLKFIHEDLAIAAYLIALWRRTNTIPRAFADLGCGNGLLVYVLSEEGYQGYGYDLRSRKLWSLYPPSTRLEERAIDPYAFDWLPAEVDWLIGNHSDELSPWLPLLAATAHYDMRYFLLPCCAYELSGAKFQRRNSRLSSYQDFYAYAHQLSDKCGFRTQQDRLKIPSTKRLALIGLQRTHAQSEQAQICQQIWSLAAEQRRQHVVPGDAVKLREKQEPVRNCTQIDRRVLDALVARIFHLLLQQTPSEQADPLGWQPGGRLRLHDIAQQLTRDELAQIKAECGGIKTLLRNRHEVFEYCGNDSYRLRRPQARDTASTNKPQTLKKRPCYFQQHHPNGCPLTDEQCTFLH